MLEVKFAPEAPICDTFEEDLESEAIVLKATIVK